MFNLCELTLQKKSFSGYNKIGPITTTGRIFCICYGLIGIPITMIIIANIGQHLNHLVRILRLKVQNFLETAFS